MGTQVEASVAYLSMTDVHKRFGGVVALAGAGLEGERGEVHALVGPNGSGKSTLNKTLTGVVAPDRARIHIDDREVRFRNPREAQRHGVAAVYQDLSVVPSLSVAANVELGIEPTRGIGFLDRRGQRRRAAEITERFAPAFGGSVPLDVPVGRLSAGEQQIVEICKALAHEPAVLILDEATASLHQAQVDVLFAVVDELRAQGVLVIFTSHRLDEVFRICDRATVLRGGETVGTVDLAETTEAELVEMMLGHRMQRHATTRANLEDEPVGAVVLDVEELVTDRLEAVSFRLHEGEILGLGGLQGQGQSELLAALFGASRIRSGRVRLDGDELRLRHPSHAVRAGLSLIPGNRTREGLFPSRTILENLTLPSADRRRLPGGLLSGSRERSAADEAVHRLSIKLDDLDDLITTLSGGNQQKIVVGKWLLTEPRIVLMDDPTKGIDVSSKQELFEFMTSLTAEGVSILFNSSENQELLDLSDRLLVLYEGRVVDVLEGSDRSEERLIAASMRVEEGAS